MNECELWKDHKFGKWELFEHIKDSFPLIYQRRKCEICHYHQFSIELMPKKVMK